jgi:hypothetical protein
MTFRPIQPGKHHIQYSSIPGETMSPRGLKPGELAVNSADGSISVVGPNGLLTTITGPNASVTAKHRSVTSASQRAYYPEPGEVVLNETTGTLWGYDGKSPGGAPQSDEQAMASGRFWATSWNADGTIKTGEAAVEDYRSGVLYAYNPGTKSVEPYNLGDVCVLRYGNYTGNPGYPQVPGTSLAFDPEYSIDNVNWSSSLPALPAGTWQIVRIRYSGVGGTLNLGSRQHPSTYGITSPYTKRVYSVGNKATNIVIYPGNIDLSGICTLGTGYWIDGNNGAPGGRVPHLIDWVYTGKRQTQGIFFIQNGEVSKTWIPPFKSVYEYPSTVNVLCVPIGVAPPPQGSGVRGGVRGDILDYLRTSSGGIDSLMSGSDDYLLEGYDKVPQELIDYIDSAVFKENPYMAIGLASLSFIEDWFSVIAKRYGRLRMGPSPCSTDVSGQDITIRVTEPVDTVSIVNSDTLKGAFARWPYGGSPRTQTTILEQCTLNAPEDYFGGNGKVSEVGVLRLVANVTVPSPAFTKYSLNYDGNCFLQVNTPDGSRAVVDALTGTKGLATYTNQGTTIDFDLDVVGEALNTIEFKDGPNFFGTDQQNGPLVTGDLYGKIHFSPTATTLRYFCGKDAGPTGMLEPESYDSLLRWFADLETQGHWNGPIILGVTTRTKYTAAGQAARAQLVSAGWTITDGGLV